MTSVNLYVNNRIAVGTEFSVRVNITDVVNFDAGNYDIDFNPNDLQVIAVSNGQIGSSVIPVDMWRDFGNGKLRIINNVVGIPGVSGTGYLADITFKLLKYVPSTSMNLSNGVLGDNLAHEIVATWAGITIAPFVVGDVTGDGLVDALDITAVEKIILELESNGEAADVNKDSFINCLDVTSIKIIIAG